MSFDRRRRELERLAATGDPEAQEALGRMECRIEIHRFVEDATPIGEMEVGERGWTVPWAFGEDEIGILHVNAKYLVLPRSGGTLKALVERTERGVNLLSEFLPNMKDQNWAWGRGNKVLLASQVGGRGRRSSPPEDHAKGLVHRAAAP